MGLGLIAIGLILLEGLELQLNSVKFFPNYIAYLILFIGILVVRRKVHIKAFDISLIIGILLYFNLIIEIPIINQNIVTFIDVILRMSFYACLFYSINQLIKDKKVVHLMESFWIIYLIITCILLLYKLNEVQNIIETQVSFLGFLLLIKTIICYVIGYYLYKYNKDLTEQYENNQIIPIKRYSQYKIFILMFICIGLLIGLEKPFIQTLKKASYDEYIWYGEIANNVIVEGQWIYERKRILGNEWDYHLPSIWINDSVYEQTASCQVIMHVGESKYTIAEQYSPLYKEYSEELLVYNGQKDGFHLMKTDYQSFNTKNIFAYRNQVSINIELYNQQKNLIQKYTVKLNNARPRMKEYEYQDQDISVEGMLVDDGFIMKLPYVTLKNKLSNNEFIVLSHSETLEKPYITIYSSSDMSYENNKYIIKERYSHYYLPADQYFYLHIVTFDNEIPHVLKTVRLVRK